MKVLSIFSLFLLFASACLPAQPQSNVWYYIVSQHSDMRVDVKGGSGERGVEIWQYTPNCSAAQHWKFISAGGGYFYIQSRVSGLYMDVRGGSRQPGTMVWQYLKNGTDAQKWRLEALPQGGYRIKSKLNGFYLEVKGRSKNSGVGLHVNRSAPNQGWFLHPVDAPERRGAIKDIDYLGNYPDEANLSWSTDVQGVAHDARHWFIVQTAAIWKVPVSQDLKKNISQTSRGVKRVGIPQDLKNQCYDHFGDPDFYKGFLFVPMETSGGASCQKKPGIAVFRGHDLQLLKFIDLGAWLENAPWCAIDQANGILYMSNYDGLNPLFRFKITLTGNQVSLNLIERRRTGVRTNQCNTAAISRIQGGTVSPNGKYLFVCTGYYTGLASKDGGIWIINLENMALTAKSYSSANEAVLTPLTDDFRYEFHPGWSRYEEPEGLTFWDLDNSSAKAPGFGGQLHVFMLDNGWPSDDIYMKHYRLDPLYEFTSRPDAILPENYTFQPAMISSLCPTHIRGDKEFKGHGPQVYAYCKLRVTSDKKKVVADLYLNAVETKSNWTEARGNWSKVIWTAPAGYHIQSIQSGVSSEVRYTDTDLAVDVFSRRGGLVKTFRINGDTRGDDVGNCTRDDVYMDVYFQPVTVKLQRLPIAIRKE